MSVITVSRIKEAIDYTLLQPHAVLSDYEDFIQKAKRFGFRRVFVSPYMVPYVSKMLEEVVVGTTAGFPHGTETIEAKVYSAELSIEKGAREIDFVINIGKALDRDFNYIEKEFLKMASLKEKLNLPEFNVKAILEMCFLSPEIVRELVEIAVSAGIDYVKTSTGFGPRGATPEDVKLLVEYARGRIKVKASGGIRTLEQVRKFLLLGADRIGTSSGDEILKEAAAILPD